MHWSRYNFLFRSVHYGRFLYNAMSNKLLEVDEPHYRTLEELRDHTSDLRTDGDGAFVSLLRECKVLVDVGEEERLLLVRQYQQHSRCFDTSRLGLTICPTLSCNFSCPYCFEHSRQDGKVMSPETVSRLMTFVERFKDIRHLSITWYGGEPTLAFHVIREVTQKVKALGLNFDGADLVTNGYLLDGEKIAQLNELSIGNIQITMDGLQEVHDRRRVLTNGGPTFQRILKNVAALMNSPYQGTCGIRVNIDKHNFGNYVELRAFMLERFRGKKLFVYPAHVRTNLTHGHCYTCSFDTQEWADFNLDMYRQAGILRTEGFHPRVGPGGCVATSHTGFVVGPGGELYKCWMDVGNPGMLIGNIYEEVPATNMELRAQYATGTDPYSDPVCRACEVLPICGGGCVNKRLRSKFFGEENLEFCSVYRHNLIPYLEAYIDCFRTREICAEVLNPSLEEQESRGYRVISPAIKNTCPS